MSRRGCAVEELWESTMAPLRALAVTHTDRLVRPPLSQTDRAGAWNMIPTPTLTQNWKVICVRILCLVSLEFDYVFRDMDLTLLQLIQL
jgi:hypothetical protein